MGAQEWFTCVLSFAHLLQDQTVHAVEFPFLNLSVPERRDQDTILGSAYVKSFQCQFSGMSILTFHIDS